MKKGKRSRAFAIGIMTALALALVVAPVSSFVPRWEQIMNNPTGGMADGTLALPSLFYLNDTNTGLYRVSADTIAFVSNGAEVFRLAPEGTDILLGRGTGSTGGSSVRFGRSDAAGGIPDFDFDNANHKLRMRGIEMSDIGDPVDLILQRAGPNGADYDGTPAAVDSGDNLGAIYWRGYGTNGDFGGRSAQIYARAREVPNLSAAAGSLIFQTAPTGGIVTDRWEIDETGTLKSATNGSVTDPALSWSTDTSEDTGFYRAGEGQIGAAIDGVEAMRLQAPTDGETALFIRRDVSGAETVQRVSMGAADGCGVGFKCLRVPN